ncbi:MAG TPA: tRNA dihydrouridine(20/20a) synthase DusA [Alkalispirochaeta sp.]|nr:tRNA dihydrouridine(20/20a) synthase DusA [Alkalispirochaeta sp.]
MEHSSTATRSPARTKPGYTDSGAPAVSVAPMMDYTDRHYRYFFRKLSTRTLLYTEMVTSSAIIHGDRDKLLAFDESEHPLALQLGGDNPDEIARAVEIAEGYGYDEYNLNVGCPSDRVQNGNFGACLMASPPHVARIAVAMQQATHKPVTIKHRIGIDGRESYEEMLEFVDTVAATGITRFAVHARIAILAGLDPKQNRSIPPLRYDDVYRLKRERPHLEIEINGHVKSIPEIIDHRRHVDAVMVGRSAYEDAWMFSGVDSEIFGDPVPAINRETVVRSVYRYLDRLEAAGHPPRRLINHMLGLFAGRPGARKWKQALSGKLPELSGRELLERALQRVPPEIRREGPRIP